MKLPYQTSGPERKVSHVGTFCATSEILKSASPLVGEEADLVVYLRRNHAHHRVAPSKLGTLSLIRVAQ